MDRYQRIWISWLKYDGWESLEDRRLIRVFIIKCLKKLIYYPDRVVSADKTWMKTLKPSPSPRAILSSTWFLTYNRISKKSSFVLDITCVCVSSINCAQALSMALLVILSRVALSVRIFSLGASWESTRFCCVAELDAFSTSCTDLWQN